MKKRYILLMMAALFMITTLLAACGDSSDEDAATEEDTEEVEETEDTGEEDAEADSGDSNGDAAGAVEGTITVSGSTSVQPLSEELAAAFMENNPDARIEVSGGGSGAGVTAAQQGAADFGAASREIAEDETGLDEYVIAIDGIAIIVHPDNPLEDIALEDVTKMFSGEITDWADAGGEAGDVVVVSREDGSGTRDAFTDIVLGDETLVDSAIIQNSTGAVAEAVSNDPNAIGYVSVGALTDEVKAVSIDGSEPSEENISSGDYTVSRPFNYVSNEEEELSEVAQAFLDFILSEEGQAVVTENGFVAVE